MLFYYFFLQIVVEEFLEDINNILNSGEVPNLFASDEYERVIIGCRPAAKEAGIDMNIFSFNSSRLAKMKKYIPVMSPP